MKNFATRTFIKGLSVVVPLALAVYVAVWLVRSSEIAAKKLLTSFLPEIYYVPGLGLLVLLGTVFLIGLLMYPWLTRKIIGGLDALARHTPLLKSVYSPIKDLMNLFSGDLGRKLGQPVMVKIPNTSIETLGFITREDAAGLPQSLLPEGHVVVHVQWSMQIGGFCFVLPRDQLRPVPISVEEGMRWALTAGLSAPRPHRL